jgi:hypothetical protein
MPLKHLNCWGTPVSDLSPLAGVPLTELDCRGTPVSDWSPLRSIKTLEHINGQPAAAFWKEVDAKGANKKQ